MSFNPNKLLESRHPSHFFKEVVKSRYEVEHNGVAWVRYTLSLDPKLQAELDTEEQARQASAALSPIDVPKAEERFVLGHDEAISDAVLDAMAADRS